MKSHDALRPTVGRLSPGVPRFEIPEMFPHKKSAKLPMTLSLGLVKPATCQASEKMFQRLGRNRRRFF